MFDREALEWDTLDVDLTYWETTGREMMFGLQNTTLHYTTLHWAGLGWVRLGWTGLDWAGLFWAVLGWVGLPRDQPVTINHPHPCGCGTL